MSQNLYALIYKDTNIYCVKNDVVETIKKMGYPYVIIPRNTPCIITAAKQIKEHHDKQLKEFIKKVDNKNNGEADKNYINYLLKVYNIDNSFYNIPDTTKDNIFVMVCPKNYILFGTPKKLEKNIKKFGLPIIIIPTFQDDMLTAVEVFESFKDDIKSACDEFENLTKEQKINTLKVQFEEYKININVEEYFK